MGQNFLAINVNDKKADFQQAPIPAATILAIAPGQTAIWVGSDLFNRQTEVRARMDQCAQAIREAMIEQNGSNSFGYYSIIDDAKSGITVANAAILPARASESVVAVNFQSTTYSGDASLLFQTTYQKIRDYAFEEFFHFDN